MAERNDVGVGTATPNLDPFNTVPANSGTSPLGAGSAGMGSNFGSNAGSLGNTGSFGGTGSGQSTAGTSGQNSGDQGGSQKEGVVQQVKDQAKNLAGEAKEQTVKVAEQARDHVQNLVSQQKDQAAEHLGSLAGALRETGRKLNEGDEQKGGFGRYADQAAGKVEQLSTYLRDGDLSGFVEDAKTFARRRPEVFLGGALLAGMALARFLKASSPETYGYKSSNQTGGNPTGGNQAGGGQAYSGRSAYAGTGRSSYSPEPDLDVAPMADAGTIPFNAPLGV